MRLLLLLLAMIGVVECVMAVACERVGGAMCVERAGVLCLAVLLWQYPLSPLYLLQRMWAPDCEGEHQGRVVAEGMCP